MAKTKKVAQEISELRRFKAGDPIHVRAQQAWLILIHYAKLGKNITYGELADLMGYGRKAARATIKPLAIIAYFCDEHGVPHLNTLAVGEKGEPGTSVIHGNEPIGVAQRRAYAFDWFAIRVPTPGTFRKVWEEFS